MLVEVHAVDPADERGREEDRRPRRDLLDLVVLDEARLGQRAHLVVLLLADQGGVDRQGVLQQRAEGSRPARRSGSTWSCTSRRLRRSSTSTSYLSNPRSQRREDAAPAGGWRAGTRSPRGTARRCAGRCPGCRRTAGPRSRRCRSGARRRPGAYSSTTWSRIAYSTASRPEAEQLRLRLQARAHLAPGPGDSACRIGDDEVRPDEHVHLAELDPLALVDVARRSEHDEQDVAVALQLGPLVGRDGVLDRERVQLELACDRRDLGVVGPVEADPGHAARARGAARRSRRATRGSARAAPVHVDGVVDHGHGSRLASLGADRGVAAHQPAADVAAVCSIMSCRRGQAECGGRVAGPGGRWQRAGHG